jgi:hypothetical protein
MKTAGKSNCALSDRDHDSQLKLNYSSNVIDGVSSQQECVVINEHYSPYSYTEDKIFATVFYGFI